MKNHNLGVAVVVVCLGLLVSAAWADSLELKNGSLIKGRYMGGSESEISFQVGSSVQRYSVADVVSVSFDSSSTSSYSPPPTPPPSSEPQLTPRPQRQRDDSDYLAPRANGRGINVPSGTRITVRTVDAIDSDRNQVGDKFQATLEQPLIVDELTVVPKGADVYGRLTEAKEAGRIQGRSQLKLELTGIVVNGQTIPLVTGDYAVSGNSRGATSAKRVGGGAAVGAVIGAIAGGGKGAAIGAGVGAGAGTAVQVMTKGEQVKVPSETLLEFALQQDVRMPAANNDYN